jgi:predicted phosphodiesterase
MPQHNAKWEEIFKIETLKEGEKLFEFNIRMATKYGTTIGNIKSKYHRHVTSKKKAKKFDESIPVAHHLPQSDTKEKSIVEIEGKKILGLFDIHIPYHDNDALHLAINHGVKNGCDTVLLGGDYIDCYEISSFEKEKSRRSFKSELQLTKQFFSFLRFKFPKARIYAKMGNHEERYERYIRKNASALDGIEDFELSNLLGFDKFGIDVIHGKQLARINSLAVVHGHEFGKSTFSPVNVARGLYLRAKSSAICGHSHQTSEHTEKDINGKLTTCWSVGCLSELNPEYAPFAKYNHGFCIITKRGKDGFSVENFRIHEGQIL